VPEPLFAAWMGKPCAPASPALEFLPEHSDAEGWAGEPQRVEWLEAQRSLDLLRAHALDMEDGCAQLAAKRRGCFCRSCPLQPWLDERTQRVELGLVSYNADYGLFSLVTVNFFFNRGGMIKKLVHVQSAWADDFDRPVLELAIMVCCDLIWVLSLTYVLACEVAEVVRTVRSSKRRWYQSIRKEYLGLWNTVDWISIGSAYVVVIAYLRLRSATADVNAEFERLTGIDVVGADDQTGRATADFFLLVETMCSRERLYRSTFTVYPMVVMARLFKSFDAQPRLAVVTRTLVNSSSDMTHFFIVFLSVYSCMMVNAILLFGQDIEDFATWDRAAITCFRVMFGDWDYAKMKKVGFVTSALWLWIFVMVISVLLLNMLLAILMDAYSEVKSGIMDSQTLYRQIKEIVRRRRQFQAGRRVRLKDIWAAFFREVGDEKEMLESKELVSPSEVLKRVPGMQSEQAKRTLKQAQESYEDGFLQPYGQNDVQRDVLACHGRTLLLRQETKRARAILESVGEDTGAPYDAQSEPQRQVVNAVREAVCHLKGQVTETLEEESQLFEGRLRELGQQEQELLVVARDTRCTLQQLHGRSESVAKVLQQLLLRHPASMPAAGPWAACSPAPCPKG